MKKLIFISHRESEANLASKLIDFLMASLNISESEIRCTSVPGHQLPFGQNISEQLKDDINVCSAVMVLLSRQSIESKWVMFELGASWALSKVIIPIISPDLDHNHLPGPINGIPCVYIDKNDASSRLMDSIKQISSTLDIEMNSSTRAHLKLKEFFEEYNTSENIGSDTRVDQTIINQAKAFKISWLMTLILMKQSRHPSADAERVSQYLQDLGQDSIEGIKDTLINDDDGSSFMELMEIIGGRFVAKQPRLLVFFETAYNMLLDGSRSGGANFINLLRKLELPEELLSPRENVVNWVNEVNQYFEDIILEG